MHAAYPALTHHVHLGLTFYGDVEIMIRGRSKQDVTVCVDFRGSSIIDLNQPDCGPTQTTLLLALTWIANYTVKPDHRERFDEIMRGTYKIYLNGHEIRPADFRRTIVNNGDRVMIA